MRNFANGYSSCDNAGAANDELALYEKAEQTGYGLEELIKKANCKDYAEFVILLYDIGALACKEGEMERIVEALDDIDSSPDY